jgi:hypothetical protein
VKRFLVYVLDAFGVSEFEASLHEELPGVDGDLGQMETPRLRNSLRVPKCLLHDFLARLFDFFGFFRPIGGMDMRIASLASLPQHAAHDIGQPAVPGYVTAFRS